MEVQALRPSAARWSATCSRTWLPASDDIAFLHSMTADSPIHGSAHVPDEHRQDLPRSLRAGVVGQLRPRASVNENLPGFVVMLDPTGGPISALKNWSSGYAGDLPGDILGARAVRRSSS